MAAIVDDVALFNKVLSQDEILDLAKWFQDPKIKKVIVLMLVNTMTFFYDHLLLNRVPASLSFL
jgi:Cdc6-like AAA superfamily ATPase